MKFGAWSLEIDPKKVDEFIRKLKILKEKRREESPLYPFLSKEPLYPEEESKSESDLEITHYDRESQQEEGAGLLREEGPEMGEGISLDTPGFRELDLSKMESQEPEEKDESSRYIDLIKTLLEEGHYDQAVEEIRELKRLKFETKD